MEFLFTAQVSNEKNPGCLVYIGDKKLPSYIGILINHEIRIPINQPVFHGKSGRVFVHDAQVEKKILLGGSSQDL